MAYWKKSVGYWLGYVWPYLFVALIVNGLLVHLVAGDERGVLGVADYVMAKGSTGKGNMYVLAFVLLGPLFNLYTTIIAIKSAVEADDDYHHYHDESPHLPLPLANTRKRFISVLSFGTGLLLLPFTFWLYTAHSQFLWGLNQPFVLQPGLWLSIALVVAGYVVIPRFLPSLATTLYDLESNISDKISKS